MSDGGLLSEAPDPEAMPADEGGLDRLIHDILESGLFDRDWYHAAHPEVPADQALTHFLETGWRAGHDPGPDFNCTFYLFYYPDVARSGTNPLVHYLRYGRGEGRQLRADDLIVASGLFDPDWYHAAHPEIPADRALAHFLKAGWRAGHDPGPGFDCAFYLAANQDVARAGTNPLLHYIQYGREEGRRSVPARKPDPDPLSAENLRPRLERFQLDVRAAQDIIEANLRGRPWPRLAPGSPAAVYVHSSGNIFMREIAELITAGLASAGIDAALYDESAVLTGDSAAVEPVARVVVAPHEFFLIPSGDRVVPPEWGQGAIMLNVEQLHTGWFRQGLSALRQAAAVIDINLASAAVLAELDFPAAYLPLGHVAGFSRFGLQRKLPDAVALETLERAVKETCPEPEAPLSERPIDVFFIGYLSPRRAGIFERLAERLSRWRCHFVFTDAEQPQVSGRNALLESEATVGLAQRSKIVLNLHQSDELFFEWHRIVLQGVWQRTLVISEPLALQASFTAGDHFLEAPVEELADVIDWVLGTPAGRQTAERVRTRAYDHLVGHVRLDEAVRAMFVADDANAGEDAP